MKCKHGFNFSKCDSCLEKMFKYIMSKKSKCYANAYINVSSQSNPTIVRTFTVEEIQNDTCITVPLTSSCNGSLLQLGSCKSPINQWCKYIDRSNGFITSIEVPKGCGGCYNFDLSASVSLTGILNTTIIRTNGDIFPISFKINIPSKVELKLSEQLPREICISDEIAESPEICFTSVTFPIIDIPYATETLGNENITQSLVLLSLAISFFGFGNILRVGSALENQNHISNLAVSGTVCLKDCQRLVPTLSIKSLIDVDILSNLLNALLTTVLVTPVTITNIQLSISSLSLKLIKLDKCPQDCSCKNKYH